MSLARSPPGGFGGAGAPPMCRPPSFLVTGGGGGGGGVSKKVASIWLKIGQRIVYGYALIASPGFRARQNSYGFRAI